MTHDASIFVETVTYTWDHRNRLSDVLRQNGNGQTLKSVHYAYDASNERLAKHVTTNGVTEYYLHDGLNLSAVLNAAGAVTTRFLAGPQANQPLAQETVSSGAVTWFLTDHQGTVRDVLDDTGNLADHIAYDSFGNVVSGWAQRFGYTGQQLDPATGLYYDHARYYDPATGQFLSQDPLGFNAGDSNLSRYVRNCPATATDPAGTTLTYGQPGSMVATTQPVQGVPTVVESGAMYGKTFAPPPPPVFEQPPLRPPPMFEPPRPVFEPPSMPEPPPPPVLGPLGTLALAAAPWVGLAAVQMFVSYPTAKAMQGGIEGAPQRAKDATDQDLSATRHYLEGVDNPNSPGAGPGTFPIDPSGQLSLPKDFQIAVIDKELERRQAATPDQPGMTYAEGLATRATDAATRVAAEQARAAEEVRVERAKREKNDDHCDPIHHVATNKHAIWTPKVFKPMFEKAGLNIDTEPANLVAVPNHKGPHDLEDDRYHIIVRDRLQAAVKDLQDTSTPEKKEAYRLAFLQKFLELREECKTPGKDLNRLLTGG